MATKQDLVGKLVVITGNKEVGYGSEEDRILGVVRSCEYAEDSTTYPLGFEGIKDSATYNVASATATALGESGKSLVAVVEKGVYVEGVAISDTEVEQPSAGEYVLADGAGGVVVVPTPASGEHPISSSVIAIDVDTTSEKATVMIL